MTLYESLSLAISVAGFTAVIISIGLLIRQAQEGTRQTKLMSESLRNSAFYADANYMFAADDIFIDHPELRPYFYSGKDIRKDDLTYDKVIAVAEFLLDFFGCILLKIQHYPQDPQIWPCNWWEEYIIDSFANSPILCEYLESVKTWYIPELMEAKRKGEKRRQQKADNPSNQSSHEES